MSTTRIGYKNTGDKFTDVANTALRCLFASLGRNGNFWLQVSENKDALLNPILICGSQIKNLQFDCIALGEECLICWSLCTQQNHWHNPSAPQSLLKGGWIVFGRHGCWFYQYPDHITTHEDIWYLQFSLSGGTIHGAMYILLFTQTETWKLKLKHICD